MQTSSIETQQIEACLLGKQQPEESLLFQARLILQPELTETMQWQQNTYRLIHLYGRQQVKTELKAVENLLFNDSAYNKFKQKIIKLFNR